MADLLPLLGAVSAFLASFRASGGRIDLFVGLPGNVNIGEMLPVDILLRIAALGIDLGVEVFSDLN